MLSFEMYFSFWFCEGNHETDNMNQMYGFEGEVKAKYTGQMFQLFSEVFQWLPLAQCINNKVLVRNKSDSDSVYILQSDLYHFVFLSLNLSASGIVFQVMHGGLFSEDGVTLDDIRKIDRNRQPPDSGKMCLISQDNIVNVKA